MKSKTFLLILTLLLFVGMTQAAVIQVAEGTDVLSAAISSAADGDVIELTTDGGIYAESAKFSSIDFSISIVATEGLVNKPVIRTPDADYMFKLTGKDAIYVFKGLEIDGTNGTGSAVAKYFLRLDTADSTGTMVVKVLNSIVHHFTDKAIKPYALTGIDSLVVDNSIFYGGAKEGIVLYTGSSSDPAVHVRYASFTNSTFHTFKREAIKGQTFDSTEVIIDRCTFYDIGSSGKGIVYFRDMTDVVVKNSIFTNNYGDADDEFADFDSDVSLFHNNVVFDVLNNTVRNATVTDTLQVDPEFADAVNADFSIPAGSVLLTHADDGGAVGDPRWIPEPTVIQVAAGTDVLSAAIASANSGDIIELTSDGGVYQETAVIVLDKSITVIGLETLPNKPIIRCGVSGDYIFKVTASNPRIVFDNVEVDGSNGTGSAYSKYFLRLDTGDSTGTMIVEVLNSVVHDFKDKHIKPYPLTGIKALKVDNSIFYGGASEGIVLYSGSSSDPAAYIESASFTNSTFYKFEREAIKGQTYPYTKVLVDRCTFYDLGENDKKAMIYFRNMEDVVVKNSIFAQNNNADAEKFADFASDVSLFHNNVVWATTNYDVGNATVSDTLHVDPQFADPASGDFTLPEGSALLAFADDGGAIGDPRWAPLEGKYVLTVYIVGNGQVTLDPDGGIYDEGTVVTLNAVPDEYWKFTGWSDNILVFPPDNPTAQATMNQNMAVTAYFEPTIEKYDVTVDAIGLGHVEIEEHSDFDLDGYYEGDSLVFTPVADTTTWEFAYWVDAAGDSIGNANPLSYIVHADTMFTAMFRSTLPQVSLTVDIVGMGDVSIDPKPVEGFETYDQGTEITLVADAFTGWEFSGWTGDITDAQATLVVTLNSDVAVTANFAELAVLNGELVVDDSWDLREALEFAKYNSQVVMIKIVSVGPFAPAEEDRSDGKLPYLNIDFPVKIVGADTLAAKPVIKGWGEGGSEGLFRLRTDGHLTLENLDIDGYFTPDKVTKYIFRLDDGDSIDVSIKADNLDLHGSKEAFLKFYALVHADTIRFTNCTVWDIGKEGIFDNAAGLSDYIELRNSTFHNVGREVLRLKAQTPTVVIDHVTVDSCGFGYGTEGDKFAAFKVENANKISITNSIISNVPNTIYGYSIRFYGEESMMDNTLLYNASRIDDNDGSVLGPDLFWFDPMFAYATRYDYTLKDSSVAYHLAGDGSIAIGDLRWATSTNVATYHALNLTVGDHGEVTVDPEPMAKFYIPGTVVSLTAEADTLYKLGEWTGDATGNVSPVTVTMDADKNVQANFVEAFFTVELNVDMSYWAFLEKFSIENDSVDIAGDFNGWGADPIWMSDEDSDSIYTASVIIDENFPNIEWKFRINGSWNDATCEFPSGGPNRTYTVTENVSLTFWYNDEEFLVGLALELIPDKYEMKQNYPNPFNPTTTIQFSLKKDGFTTLVVYDMLGREVARLVNKDMKAGYHQVVFSDMARLASGVYIYKLTSGDFSSVKKMVLMK